MMTGNGARFEKARLYNKLACIMGETNLGLLESTSTIKAIPE